ncbi:hypothetical protein ACHAXN_013076 [Cyclotella atomus]
MMSLDRRLASMSTLLLVLLQFIALPGISSWPWNKEETPQKIKPKVTRPSGPTNVSLFVVSRTELGVKWDPPLFDGGKSITKYLVEWDMDKHMTSGIASPSNPYGNGIDGPLVRSEVVWGKTEFRITGLAEGQRYYVRVSAYGDGYSNAISTNPSFAIPSVMLPGYLTDVSLSIATDTDTSDRLHLAWSAAKVDVNGFSVLPNGCAGGETPPASPDAIESHRVQWDTHPSFSNAKTVDIPAVSGDGVQNHCCSSCDVEIGAEVQTFSIMYPSSTVPSNGNLFDRGGVRIAYVGPQSKSIKIETPDHGSSIVRLSPSLDLPASSPIKAGDIIRIHIGVYLVSNVDNWPEYITLASDYQSSSTDSSAAQAYFSTPPSTCFDLSGLGNSADNFRSHIAQSFDNSPFDESITVSRSTVTALFAGSLSNQRIIGYEYHVTFTGQGFSSTVGHEVEDLIIISTPSSPFSSVGSCGDPFVSSGDDVSSQVSLQVTTNMDSGSVTPGQRYYVQIAGVNTLGVGPFVTATPASDVPMSLPGLAQNCKIFALPTSSSSLKVEWNGVQPFHGQHPNAYRIDLYDVDAGSSSPVKSQLVSEIDETTKYSITINDLAPGTRYKALVVPINDLGEGGPSWLADFDPSGLINDAGYSVAQDYLDLACNAVPTCEAASVECLETEISTFTILTRSVPAPPSMEVGTHPSVSNANRFSRDSTLVTFQSHLLDHSLHSTGSPTDKFRIEWSTNASFRRSSSDGSASFWSVEIPASYSDGRNEYMIDSLDMGMQYYVRVFAHNSAGYGSASMAVPIKPMTRPDPPFDPILSSVSLEDITTSSGFNYLLIADLVGNGGDAVTSYLVEWSRLSFDSYNPTMVEISLKTSGGAGGSSATGLLSGSFQLIVDTTISPETAVRGIYSSASIPVDSSDAEIKIILENMPNVGEANVHSSDPFTWILTFPSEVGDIGISVGSNDIQDDALAAGIIDIVKLGAGSLPNNAAYGFEIIDNFDQFSSDHIHYTIQHLVPGMQIFTRVSAGNQVGFGPRRKTAPEFISPSLQRPEQPISLYNSEAAPHLSVHSPTSLEVHIGPPAFDGGSPLTTFLIEWDLKPSFSSSLLRDGSALGYARVNAASRLCTLCVGSFDLSTNTFTYSGDTDIAKLLIPQRKIMVYFSDDNTHYLFSIVSATPSVIIVSEHHLRVSSLQTMMSQNGSASSDLDMMGAKYIIRGLDTGTTYHVRVSSENGEGTGRSVATNPHHETPRGFPRAPSDVAVNVKDKNTLEVSWSNSTYTNDPDIQAFRVERFCRSDAASSVSHSFFGEQEVVEFSSLGLGLVDGTFTVYFGDFSSKVFLGHVKTANGLNYVETIVDLTAHLERGETVLIGEEEYTVDTVGAFTSSRLPLSTSYTGDDNEIIAVYARSKSVPISFDASADELQNALERMPNVNHVQVRRDVVDNTEGYQWFVTFTSNVGPQPAFSIDTTFLVGANQDAFSANRIVAGVLPNCYSTFLVQPTSTSLELQDLVTGKAYYVRVASISDSGESDLVASTPISISPGGVPDPVSLPHLKALNENTLLVTFEAPSDSNGAPINQFVVESSRDPSFSSNTRIDVQPDYKVQRVTTRAHSLPWDENSSFTLSLGDFHGDFTEAIGSGTTVRVTNGNNLLERSTGTASLSSFVARGDYLLVGGIEFRVCLDTLDAVPYDVTHISLCSTSNPLQPANFISPSSSSIIDELPIFRLDTSLGASKSPSVGDIYLSTVDSFGSSQDTRGRLRRGDLVRVGHPDFGETFRVSTDETRTFDDRVIPLGNIKDPETPSSLSLNSLQHSTYEVQSFYIRSNSDTTTLTPSNTLNSGYRIRFKAETSHQTSEAGSSGCLKWDGSANALKSELESLSGIDAVKVSRQDLAAVPGGVGAGVKYFITFTGDNVRGNVPPVQIVDVGTNGCLDAADRGGTFGDSLAPIVVQQVEIPYIPFYEVQTTIDIPHNASAEDMKSAIESLSQACTVTVSRVSIGNGFSWDVTFAEHKQNIHSPLLVISVNGENLSALVDPHVSAVGLQKVEVPTVVQAAPYFIRVAAVNSFGTGPFALSNPRALQAAPQPPSAPVDLFVEAVSDSELLVQWNTPLENGGQPVTHYKVEYDGLPSFSSGANGGPYGSVSVSSSSIAGFPDVQSITVKIDSGGVTSSLFLSGTFSLTYDGQTTEQLPYNAPAQDVKNALESLCTVEEVSVTRSILCSPDPHIGCMQPDGYTWLVTFVSIYDTGDQHRRATSCLSDSFSHKLSADGSHLFECTDVDRASCSIGGRATASIGTTQEVQRVILGPSSFSVTIGSETSDVIQLGDSLASMEAKINAFSKNEIGKVVLSCLSCDESAIAQGDLILFHFLSYRGDLPEIIVSDPAALVSEVVKGNGQFVVGRSSYSTIISELTSLNDWYVRVYAYNNVGEGPSTVAWPSPLRLTSVAPQAPQDVSVAIDSASSLAVSWNRPGSIGGVQLTDFIIEYDTISSFGSNNGLPLGQVIVTAADADNSIGFVTQSYPGSSDPILRRRIIIDDISLISGGIVHVGSELVIEGQRLTVIAINAEGCGSTCLSMDQDYFGITPSGTKVYDATNAMHFGATIPNLIPGQPYFVRVAAANEVATGQFAYFANSLGPASYTPMGVPNAISWASLASIDSDKLRVDFGAPENVRPEGINGAPVLSYQVDVAIDAVFRPEIISLTTQAEDQVSGFMELSAGFQGEYDMLIAVGNQPANFMIVPGSRWVDTMGIDLRSVLHAGETILIECELVVVGAVDDNGFEIKEYHIKGTGDQPVFGYRMNSYIGAATLSSGDATLIESSGQNLEAFVKPGDSIQVMDDTGAKIHLTVTAVSGTTVDFSPRYAGGTVTTPIHARRKVIVSSNASCAEMKTALESLPDIGSVDVTREGPNQSEGYTWYITFISNVGATSIVTSTESVSYIAITGMGQGCDGYFIADSVVNGRPRYNLLGKSCHIAYDSDASEWRMYSSTNSLLSSVAEVEASAPSSGWSNGAVITLSDNTSVTLLTGQGSTAQVSLMQPSVDPSFENIVLTTEIDAGEKEVQEIVISSTENDLGGSFELALGTGAAKVTVYFDDSAGDLTSKLQSLPDIGRVQIESENLSSSYGHVWTITFLSNSGDVPMLRHFGTSSLQGTGVTLEIQEVVKGSVGDRHIIVDNLDAGIAHSVRIRALNDYGYGPYTTLSQTMGSGVHPLAMTVASPPGEPIISTGRVTKSRAELLFTTPPFNGNAISSYKFEWSTGTSFDSLAHAQLRIACSDLSDILGSFTLIYGSDVTSRAQVTVPLGIGSSVDEIKQALDALTLLGEVEVTSTIDSSSELEWAITFVHDVGSTGLLSVDSSGIRCRSEAEVVESDVRMFPSGDLPIGYGSQELFTNDYLCGSVYLASSSSHQKLFLTATSAVSRGSYQLMLDDESTACISFDATADQVKAVIEGLSHVESVEITSLPAALGFPYSYEISFIGTYAYGDWPALRINPSHFGAGACDAFVGGSGHKAVILPVRDESLCANGRPRTVAIVADALTTLGGSFAVQFGTQYSPPVSFDTSGNEMAVILQELTGVSDIRVSKHNYQDFAVGMAWSITFPRQTNDDNIFRVVDTRVTGKNARVAIYPVLKLSSFSAGSDTSGDFRIILDNEPTAPLSHHATNKKLLRELHRHNGLGKVNMLGPEVSESVSSLAFDALVDDSFIAGGLKAVAVVGDLTTTVAPGDKITVGSCADLVIESVEHEEYDALQSAGYLFESLYLSSPQTEKAILQGYTVLPIQSSGSPSSFTSDCDQVDAVTASISIGSVLLTSTGVDHSVIVKSHLANLDTIRVVPESNWRGTGARLSYQPPSGLLPNTFTLDGMDKSKTYIIRASARNSRGYGNPSNILQVQPRATVPSAPLSVSLESF